MNFVLLVYTASVMAHLFFVPLSFGCGYGVKGFCTKIGVSDLYRNRGPSLLTNLALGEIVSICKLSV